MATLRDTAGIKVHEETGKIAKGVFWDKGSHCDFLSNKKQCKMMLQKDPSNNKSDNKQNWLDNKIWWGYWNRFLLWYFAIQIGSGFIVQELANTHSELPKPQHAVVAHFQMIWLYQMEFGSSQLQSLKLFIKHYCLKGNFSQFSSELSS